MSLLVSLPELDVLGQEPALHLHVNTVHYRIQRIEVLTDRDLSRLDHKLDLRAALLCR